jgi:hypothetical protein
MEQKRKDVNRLKLRRNRHCVWEKNGEAERPTDVMLGVLLSREEIGHGACYSVDTR